MNRASRRGQNKNINTYCHTRWSPFSPLDRHYPSIVAATSNLAPFSSLSLLTGREGRCSCDTHRQRLIHETLQNGYTPAQILFPSVLTATHASCIFRRLTITLRKLLLNTHFDDIARVTRFFPCSNLTEKNHVVTRSTSTKTENIDTCDLFIHVKSRENRY